MKRFIEERLLEWKSRGNTHMKRFIEERLLEWKDSTRRKPLIVRGARQVGKTYSIQKFGRSFFSNLLTVDLEKERNLHGVFETDLNPDTIS